MAIKTGRYGEVLYDPAGGATPTAIASINKFTLSLKTEKLDVTCFQDENRVYIPSMKDVSGTFGGFYNSEDLTLFEAADAPTPGMLKLVPNTTEPTFFWQGLAYLDADVEVDVQAAPTISGTFSAAGPWTREPVVVLDTLRGDDDRNSSQIARARALGRGGEQGDPRLADPRRGGADPRRGAAVPYGSGGVAGAP